MSLKLFLLSLLTSLLFFSGCKSQPSVPKNQYVLDESKTVAPKKNGELNGVVKKYAKDGRLWSMETYVDGKREGIARYYSYNDKTRAFNNGKAWVREECTYKNDKKDGICKIYDIEVKLKGGMDWKYVLKQTVPYVNGEKHGVMKTYVFEPYRLNDSYNDREIPYKHGKLNGTFKRWELDNGKRVIDKIVNYKNDLKDGVQIEYGLYHEEIKTKFKDGVEVGPRVTTYKNGHKEIKRFDKASIQAEKERNRVKRAKKTQQACAYAKRYIKTPGALRDTSDKAHERFVDATRICKYGWMEGDANFF